MTSKNQPVDKKNKFATISTLITYTQIHYLINNCLNWPPCTKKVRLFVEPMSRVFLVRQVKCEKLFFCNKTLIYDSKVKITTTKKYMKRPIIWKKLVKLPDRTNAIRKPLLWKTMWFFWLFCQIQRNIYCVKKCFF